MTQPLHGEMDVGLGRLRFDELHSFVVLSEELNFTRAARRLLVTTGGLSRRISHLERAVGATLLHRTTRSVRLTAEGGRLAPAVRCLVTELQTLCRQTDNQTLHGRLPPPGLNSNVGD